MANYWEQVGLRTGGRAKVTQRRLVGEALFQVGWWRLLAWCLVGSLGLVWGAIGSARAQPGPPVAPPPQPPRPAAGAAGRDVSRVGWWVKLPEVCDESTAAVVAQHILDLQAEAQRHSARATL
ncbi:MAG: hypothetical protein ACKOJF_19140, partial [Planctomycetaceae bacterium]